MFIPPKIKANVTTKIDDDFLEPAKVIFYPEQEKEVEELIGEYVDLQNVSEDDRDRVSKLTYDMLKAKELDDYEAFKITFLHIINKYK